MHPFSFPLLQSLYNDLTIFIPKVGKGLSKDEKARKLALQHWLEAVRIFFYNLSFSVAISFV